MTTSTNRIHSIPLESDPSIFTDLIGALGLHSLRFTDVLSLDVADLAPTGALALPQPVYALIFLFPTSETYERDLKAKKRLARLDGSQYSGSGPAEPVIWFDQTIHNACGLYAILHAVSNLGPASAEYMSSGSLFKTFLDSCIDLDPTQRAKALESSLGIAEAYRQAATQGGTAVPNAEDEVEFHYICFVKSSLNGHIYELDGDRNGPIDRQGDLDGETDLLTGGLQLVNSVIQAGNPHFQLMALVPEQ
ncbi:ubiquitin C-terminal hydrolase L3 [Roridomyces roridus]|uniref:Ubiquitin carboxyl-terminal hydrolase n=1 Tax=Roridomyces roridus TaxID=1738132 RepID=A0AAD7FK46_9AGAR|nr:ubiquitin C-terminal hydrolase L3 [Roridomyces roridus]